MPQLVVVSVFDGIEPLDIFGPIQVFSTANRLLGAGDWGYDIVVAGAAPGVVRCAGGAAVLSEQSWDLLTGKVDTLVVPGGVALDAETTTATIDHTLVDWLSAHAESIPRIASVCTGTHILAAAGLLTDRRVTTHWSTTDQLATRYPELRVDSDGIFIRDGNIWTSAGGTAGIDLALALVAEDYGTELARKVARALVMSVRRSEGQKQHSELLATPKTTDARIADLEEWIRRNLARNLSVQVLAAKADLSPRHFARVFREKTGTPPAQYVEDIRAEEAAHRLVHTTAGLRSVAQAVGFGSVETLHRVFKRHYGQSPAAYREQFSTPAPATLRSGHRWLPPRAPVNVN